MTIFSVVLFLHLLGAVSLFIAYGIEWTASSLFRNASTTEQARSWLRVFKVSPPLSGVGLGVVLLSGGYLASLSGAMKQGWIPATLIAIFVALVVGFALILPRMKRIRAALPSEISLVPSLVALIIAIVFGLIFSISTWSRTPATTSKA